MPKLTDENREKDLASLTLELKKLNDDSKREGAERLSKSSNKADREMAENWKKNLANDTATMIQTNEGYGRRIGPDGRPVGPELKKLGPGEYKTEGKKTEGKKKGGMISASARADGCAQRGKTKGRMV